MGFLKVKKVRQLTKTQLFYKEITKVIQENLSYKIDAERINNAVKEYLNSQSYLKRVGRRWDDNIFMFIVLNLYIDIIPEYIKHDKSRLIDLMIYVTKYQFKKSSDTPIINIMQSKKFNQC